VSDAASKPRAVEFIDMPPNLRGQYQSFTQAPMQRLRAAGYTAPFTPLEEGIRRYVQEHLATPDIFL
jgi:ADP-L-glycero-D-manno-heptose 6-epimerase